MRLSEKNWWSRIVAILYAWTLGAIIGVVFLTLAFLYGILGTVLRLFDAGNQTDIPFWKPVKSTVSWWVALHLYALTGNAPPGAVPPVLD